MSGGFSIPTKAAEDFAKGFNESVRAAIPALARNAPVACAPCEGDGYAPAYPRVCPVCGGTGLQ